MRDLIRFTFHDCPKHQATNYQFGYAVWETVSFQNNNCFSLIWLSLLGCRRLQNYKMLPRHQANSLARIWRSSFHQPKKYTNPFHNHTQKQNTNYISSVFDYVTLNIPITLYVMAVMTPSNPKEPAAAGSNSGSSTYWSSPWESTYSTKHTCNQFSIQLNNKQQ